MSRGFGMSQSKSKDVDCPLDTVQQIVWDRFSPQDRGFLVASWDGYIRHYSVKGTTNEQVVKNWEFFLGHPVLCCDMGPNLIVLVGLANGQIVAIDMQSNQAMVIGVHNAPLCGLFWVEQLRIFFSIGIDNMLKFWTFDTNNNNNNYLYLQRQLPQKIYCVSFDFPYIFLCSKTSKLGIISIATIQNGLIIPNKFQSLNTIQQYSKMNCCKINANKKYYAIGTLDGRSILGQFKEDYNLTYSFPSPTVTKTQKKEAYKKSSILSGQINAVDIGVDSNSVYYISGGTHELSVFNMYRKQKAKNIVPPFNKYNFTALSINPIGDYLAYAVGNDWNEGISQLQMVRKPRIHVVKFTLTELKSFVSSVNN